MSSRMEIAGVCNSGGNKGCWYCEVGAKYNEKSGEAPGKAKSRGATEEKVRISPGEVAVSGRDRRKSQDKSRGSRSGGA